MNAAVRSPSFQRHTHARSRLLYVCLGVCGLFADCTVWYYDPGRRRHPVNDKASQHLGMVTRPLVGSCHVTHQTLVDRSALY
ncbi:hypothetical protein BaRGS_00006661 [Batillaria attramentaria]|uniref:Secreted protein n=1 Tax=Batillaria attramentaria TaxID=370345 RepID=A0ABD0LSE1_9CAEN